MENASKALLIAGAILIAIILIGIGVAVITSTSNIQDQAGSNAETMAIQTFNSQFTAYAGTISASQATQLKSAINASNAQSSHQVKINSGSDITITTGKKYEVSFDYGSDGYINDAKITAK